MAVVKLLYPETSRPIFVAVGKTALSGLLVGQRGFLLLLLALLLALLLGFLFAFLFCHCYLLSRTIVIE